MKTLKKIEESELTTINGGRTYWIGAIPVTITSDALNNIIDALTDCYFC